jgi:flagellar basal-body rod modification protein FlgD
MTSPVTPSTGVNVTPTAPTSANSGVPSFTSNFNTFLTLLTTQLQNQDPLSPLDTSQFTQQLVAFSGVEQQIQTNSNLTQLIQLQNTNEAIAAAPLVGQSIEYSSPTAPLANSAANFSYTLPSTASSVNLMVSDASGNVVYSSTGNTAAGQHDFQWNGQTSAGVQLPDGGQYTLSVVAADASKNAMTATVTSFGVVDGVNITPGTPATTTSTSSSAPVPATTNLDVDGVTVGLGELMSINPTFTPGS